MQQQPPGPRGPPEVVELLDTTSEEESIEDGEEPEQSLTEVDNSKQEHEATSSSSSDSHSHSRDNNNIHDDDDDDSSASSYSTTSSSSTRTPPYSRSPSILPALFQEAGWDSPGDYYCDDDHDSLASIENIPDQAERRLVRSLHLKIQRAEETEALDVIEAKIAAQEQREIQQQQQQQPLLEPEIELQPQDMVEDDDDSLEEYNLLNAIEASIDAKEQREKQQENVTNGYLLDSGSESSHDDGDGDNNDDTEPPAEFLALVPQQTRPPRSNQSAKVWHSEIAWFSSHNKTGDRTHPVQHYQMATSSTTATPSSTTTTDPYAALNGREVQLMATIQRKRPRQSTLTPQHAKPKRNSDLSDTESESDEPAPMTGATTTTAAEEPPAGCNCNNGWQVDEAVRRLATFFTDTPLVRATHVLPKSYIMDTVLQNFVRVEDNDDNDDTTTTPGLVARYKAKKDDDVQHFLSEHSVLRTYRRSLLLEEFQAELYTVAPEVTKRGRSSMGGGGGPSLQLRLRGRRPMVAGMGEWCAWQIQQAMISQTMRSLLGDPQRYELTVRLPFAVLAAEALSVSSHPKNGKKRGAPVLVPQPGATNSFPYYWIDPGQLDQGNPLLKSFLHSLLGTEILNQPGLVMALQGFEFTNTNHQRMCLSNMDHGNEGPTNSTASTTTRIRVLQSNYEKESKTVYATLVVSSFVNVTTALALKRKIKSAVRLLVEGTRLRRPGLSKSAAEEAELNDMGQQQSGEHNNIGSNTNDNNKTEPRPVDTIHLHPLEETGDADTIISEISVLGIHSDKHDKTVSGRSEANKQFKAKFRDVYLIEYQRCEITYAFCMSQMWAQHKKHFGSKRCEDDCPCAVYVGDLTENIVGQFLDKQLRDAPAGWTVPKDLQDRDESPVGFVNHFGTFSH